MYLQHYLIITHLLESNSASKMSMEFTRANLPVPQPLSRHRTQTKLRMDAAVPLSLVNPTVQTAESRAITLRNATPRGDLCMENGEIRR